MLVVTSNWCISDGTLATGLPSGCVARFRAEVQRASLRCGFRRDGSYRPVEAVDVVLAGDTFDWLVSREWTGDVRPWDPGRRAAASRERVAAAALGRADRLLATLAAWMRRGIEVPAADRRGRPMQAASRLVPVQVAVLSGDRDRWLEEAAGGVLPPGRTAVVGRCWSDGEVTVRHAEELDPLHAVCGREPTLGESLAVDLIARFGGVLADCAAWRPLAGGLIRRLAAGVLVDAPTRLFNWLSDQEGGGRLTAAGRQELIDAWHRSVVLWQRAARRLSPRGDNGVDLVGRIAEGLAVDDVRSNAGTNRWLDAVRTGGVAVPPDSAVTAVLGHPSVDAEASAAWRRQVVCLGPGVSTPLGRRDDLPTPAAVLIRPERGGRQIEQLPIDNGGSRIGCGHDDERGHGVWLSAASLGRNGIVDAA
jgi:hypothetical protein